MLLFNIAISIFYKNELMLVFNIAVCGFNIKTFSIMTLSITTLSIKGFIATFSITTLIMMVFSITTLCIMLNVVLLSVPFHLLLC